MASLASGFSLVDCVSTFAPKEIYLSICRKIYGRRKERRYTLETSGIYLSLILLCKKKLTFIVPSFELKVCVRVELCCSVELEGGSAA